MPYLICFEKFNFGARPGPISLNAPGYQGGNNFTTLQFTSFWPQKWESIIKKHVVWKSRFTQVLPDYAHTWFSFSRVQFLFLHQFCIIHSFYIPKWFPFCLFIQTKWQCHIITVCFVNISKSGKVFDNSPAKKASIFISLGSAFNLKGKFTQKLFFYICFDIGLTSRK